MTFFLFLVIILPQTKHFGLRITIYLFLSQKLMTFYSRRCFNSYTSAFKCHR